eukprot:CAMPEP_0172501836 /NCGR_PEP_ID=MMETSP1066-20121228/154026_1 /TAXON_ID=671091 /ORGANISM="Coscinodiscus wailesii, Strain CCMP2513" /LENGTH=103 /DNA_ID=CAMNT_0013276849 /DNA_START=118 /DNA_END=429 /DNA_ORIENTATION=+
MLAFYLFFASIMYIANCATAKDEWTQTEAPTRENQYGNPHPVKGPWPECIGWHGEDCKTYLKNELPDAGEIDFGIVKPGEPNSHRVYIIVDENNIVHKIPHRG